MLVVMITVAPQRAKSALRGYLGYIAVSLQQCSRDWLNCPEQIRGAPSNSHIDNKTRRAGK